MKNTIKETVSEVYKNSNNNNNNEFRIGSLPIGHFKRLPVYPPSR